MDGATQTELLHQLVTDTEDPLQRAEIYSELLFSMLFEPGGDLYTIGIEAHKLNQELNYLPGLALSTTVMALEDVFNGRYESARNALLEALDLFQQTGHTKGYPLALALMALVHNSTGDYGEALRYALPAVQQARHSHYRKERGFVRYTLATIYLDTREYEQALTYYKEALEEWRRTTHLLGLGRSFNGAGVAYMELGDLEAALYCQQEALKVYQQGDVQRGIARTYDDLGRIYTRMGRYHLAHSFLQQALDIRRTESMADPLASTLHHYAQLHILEEQYHLALQQLQEAIRLARELGSLAKLARLYRTQALAYRGLGDYRNSMLCYEQYHELHERIFHSEMHDKVKNLEMQLQQERSEREHELTRLRNVELANLNDELQHALSTIHDSIDYARRIQEALLPSHELRARLLPDSFVFYRPRDVVSGDFYWMAEAGGRRLLAVVDCTGHGVPGAFMSLLGISLLNEMVLHRGETCPSHLLSLMNARLKEVLGSSEVLDGMEAGIVSWNEQILQYAGAGIPMYHVAGGVLSEHASQSYGLGGRQESKNGYVDTTLTLQPGDGFYLFSDGFKDQFGWHRERREKFSRNRFRQMIEEVGSQTMAVQGQHVEKTFAQWQGRHRQVDDVLLVGFRL